MPKAKRNYLTRGRVLKSNDLDTQTFSRVVARRARALGRKYDLLFDKSKRDGKLSERFRSEVKSVSPIAAPDAALSKKVRAQEKSIKEFYEKVHEDADFLPARFLEDGARLVPAVCRMAVVATDGNRYTGTGFLVAPGFIMTNNHVLETTDWAEHSLAIFDFQEGGDSLRVGLEPERFFLTNKALDYTIVACNERLVQDIAPVPLLQNPSLITRGERVYIIQHPRGRPKEVVLRNNEVTRVRDTVVHYRADTEGGSSGSPVFNEDWELVALHHAGWTEGPGRTQATNEGVSIAAIIRHLQGRSDAGSGNRGVERILANVRDSSPFLGFFDHQRSYEVSVGSWTGSSDYADIGFWNIENFNDNIGDRRVETVADVVSKLALDAFGLTEVEKGAVDKLIARLELFGDSYGAVLENTPGSQDIAILYDRDTTKVERLDDIYERHKTKLKARTGAGKTAFPRYPLFAKCTIREALDDEPVEFVMIVVHLKAYVSHPPSRDRRALAAEKLAEIVEDIRTRLELPVVIGGDYNELITTDVLAPLSDSPDLFALTTDDAEDGGISYVGGRHRSLIDHIIVSRDVPMGSIQDDDAAIVRLDRSVSDFASKASDHVPIVMRMVYRDQAVDEPDGKEGSSLPVPQGARRMTYKFE